MPIFEYYCHSCGHDFEKILKAGAPAAVSCPQCGSSETAKKISAFSGIKQGAECFSGG